MKVRNIIFTLLILFTGFQFGFSQEKIIDNSCQIPFQLKLEKTEVLFLILESQYFEPRKLKTLFLCLSQKRAKLAFLHITALSNEEQLDRSIKDFIKPYSPLEAHKPYYPKGWKPVEPPAPNYYRAYYKRYKNESFEYSPNPQKWEMTTDFLKNNIVKK